MTQNLKWYQKKNGILMIGKEETNQNKVLKSGL